MYYQNIFINFLYFKQHKTYKLLYFKRLKLLNYCILYQKAAINKSISLDGIPNLSPSWLLVRIPL